MNCLRCGYCCHRLSVIIVSDPKLGIVEGNLEHRKGMGPCKHLRGNNPGNFSCAIHNKSWYDCTPCSLYSQIGEGDCRIGKAIMSGQIKPLFLEEES